MTSCKSLLLRELNHTNGDTSNNNICSIKSLQYKVEPMCYLWDNGCSTSWGIAWEVRWGRTGARIWRWFGGGNGHLEVQIHLRKLPIFDQTKEQISGVWNVMWLFTYLQNFRLSNGFRDLTPSGQEYSKTQFEFAPQPRAQGRVA